ncbi:hypothetical protein [Paenibacillus sp. SI8]|uniref:hypothetical protein n=1 Tax=unclassified Paenibacillus TaxID=185978 RepID=UPI0034674DCB
MSFKKKGLLSLSVVLLCSSIMSSIAFGAKSDEPNEFIIKPGNMKIQKDPAASKEEIESIVKKLQEDFNKKAKNYKRAEEVQRSIEDINPNSIAAATGYDENKAKLRQANYIESVLDTNEGMTGYQIFLVGVLHANAARDEALSEYPNDVMTRDAYRHYTWNFRATKDSAVGKTKTRTATINHEWGVLLLNFALNYYDQQYNSYINSGKSDYVAANQAFSDVTLWMPELKMQLISIFKSNYSKFKGFFQVSNIMDLTNNCWGRSGPTDHSNSTPKQAFALDKNNLILSESSVYDYQYNIVWQNQWYTY